MNSSNPNPLQRFTMPKGWETIWTKTIFNWKRAWLQNLMPHAEIVSVSHTGRDKLTVIWRHRNET